MAVVTPPSDNLRRLLVNDIASGEIDTNHLFFLSAYAYDEIKSIIL